MSRWAVGSSRTRIGAAWASGDGDEHELALAHRQLAHVAVRAGGRCRPGRSRASTAARSAGRSPPSGGSCGQPAERDDLLDAASRTAAAASSGHDRDRARHGRAGRRRRSGRRAARPRPRVARGRRSAPGAASTCRRRSDRRGRAARPRAIDSVAPRSRSSARHSRWSRRSRARIGRAMAIAVTARTPSGCGAAGTGRTARRGAP